MAGLIAALKGRKREATPYDPNLAGLGGVTAGPGPAGESGFPGSTSATRTFRYASPRDVKIESDTLRGFDQGFEGTETRQVSRTFAEGNDSPRDTPEVTTPRPRTIGSLRRSPGEWYGGVPLRSDAVSPATHAAGSGLNPLSGAAAAGGHSVRDTETPATDRQPDISGGVPGSSNVRNTIALRYKEQPGLLHAYKPRSRPDQPGLTPPNLEAPDLVTVPSRYKWGGTGGGVQTWSAERQMPYTGRGAGARGADLNGTRYYAEGPPVNVNGGQGDYGVARLRGPRHRPVFFAEPAPWTAQYYDTTASVGTPDAPGPGGQSPDLVYYSPDPGRSGMNATGR